VSRVLVVAEHDSFRLDPATAKCVRCALDLKPEALVVAVLARGGADVAAQAARLSGVTEVVLVDAAHNAAPLAAIFAPQLASLAEGYTHVLGPSSTFGKDPAKSATCSKCWARTDSAGQCTPATPW
jgi:electron transfer flavoprotein alpha subunit